MMAIAKGSKVPRFVPATDELFKSGSSLRCHDEGESRFKAAHDCQLGHFL
jgi:hypothetical protein